MKKRLILLFMLILCTGCMRIDNRDNYDDIVDNVINNKYVNQNTTSLGYTYYLPLGVSKVYDKDYNQKFKIENTYMYLYVDVVSYYYRNTLNFDMNNTNNFYYHKISNGDKNGYVMITKNDDLYFVKVVYNYAKIESYATKTKLSSVLTSSIVILNSINYNDSLIEKMLRDENYIGSEKEYKIDKPTDAESKFSEYLSEYVQEEESVIPDLPEY